MAMHMHAMGNILEFAYQRSESINRILLMDTTLLAWVCTRVYMHAYTHTYTRAYTCLNTCVYADFGTHTCPNIRNCTFEKVCTSIYTHSYTQNCAHVCINITTHACYLAVGEEDVEGHAVLDKDRIDGHPHEHQCCHHHYRVDICVMNMSVACVAYMEGV